MRLYLDLCCLKRPFDLQAEPLIRLQTEAVLSLLALPQQTVEFVRSQAQALENSLDPIQARRDAVALWIAEAPAIAPESGVISQRTTDLMMRGMKSFDAFHVASAELAGATVFLTVDLPLLRLAARLSEDLRVRITDPIQFIEELSQWKQ